MTLLTSGCVGNSKDYAALLQSDPPGPDDVSVTWFGVASTLISDGKNSILIDPFVTRPSLFKVATARKISPDPVLIEDWIHRLGIAKADAVIVTHSHYDHLMDAPEFAIRTGATLIGSPSTLQAGLGAEMHCDQMTPAMVDRPFEFGAFKIHLRRAEHGPVICGKILFDGTIDSKLKPPAPACAYRTGEVYQVLVEHPQGSILVYTSPGIPTCTFTQAQLKADLVLLAVGGLKKNKIHEYLETVACAAEAKAIIPTHFESLFRPLSKPIVPMRTAPLKSLAEASARHGISLHTVPVGVPRRAFISE